MVASGAATVEASSAAFDYIPSFDADFLHLDSTGSTFDEQPGGAGTALIPTDDVAARVSANRLAPARVSAAPETPARWRAT